MGIDMNTKWIWILAVPAITLLAPLASLAQGPQAAGGRMGLDLSLSAIQQFEADIGKSQVDVSRHQARVDIDLVKNRRMIMSLGASARVSDYTFSGPPADPWSDPWGEIHSVDTGLTLILPGSGQWSYFLAGSLDWAWEDDADTSDALVYGIIASTSRNFQRDRRLGFGVGIFDGLEEAKIFPYAVVSWRLKEKLILQNPFSAGPAGPAGLELAWDASEKWQVGGGTAYRSFRFRLNNDGIAPGGVGGMTGVPVWVRASWQTDPKLKLHLHTGAILAGEVILKNSSGRKLESKHMDIAPLAAVTLELSL